MLKVNKLTLVNTLPRSSTNQNIMGLFKCDCGNFKELPISAVKTGKTKSCGCLKVRSDGVETTRKDKVPYRKWINMMCRCYQSGTFKTDDKRLKFLESTTKHKSYDDYGKRGIDVCPEWFDVRTYVDWYHLNIKDKESVDRIENDKGYYPSNCRGVTFTEQNLNRRMMSTNTTGYNGVMLKRSNTYSIKVKYHNVSYTKYGFKSADIALIERNAYIINTGLPHNTQYLKDVEFVNVHQVDDKTIISYTTTNNENRVYILSIDNFKKELIDRLKSSLMDNNNNFKETKMSKKLVLVESPSKAKTISKILGNDFVVLASYGHVMDLPKDKLGFDANNNFNPDYNITVDKKKVINDIKNNYNKDTIVYLSSDFDREGHLIAKHLVDILKIPKERYKRIEVHEITKQAILHAIDNPVKLDLDLADAAIARRVLDRAVGYELSPLLWKKIRRGLSAGRVQSVATRIIVDRELEIRDFKPEEYWKIKVDFINPSLRSELVKHNGKDIKITNEIQAKNIEVSLNNGNYQLVNIEEKDSIRNPSPPFTTSTLQQEASRKIGLSVKNTMSIAQQLYEGNVGNIPHHTGGLITYMRTDSLSLSTLALDMCKEVIIEEYGIDNSISTPRVFKTKSKGAQEAHEAIRPVNMKLKPSMVKAYLEPQQYRLYDLIWKRTVATQMAPAKIANTIYNIEAGSDKEYTLQSKGTRIVNPGFMLVYTEGSDNPESALDNKDVILPNIKINSYLTKDLITLEQKFTLPPARYTEASLVKKLESVGVGRPSTFASTISTIMGRGYVVTDEDKKLLPTPIGETVTEFLKEHFPDIVDIQFTANIEKEFDTIAAGEIKWTDVMSKFYGKFKANIIDKDKNLEKDLSRKERVIGVDSNNKPITARMGRFGAFVQVGNKEDGDKPKYVSIPDNLRLETITLEEALALLVFPRLVGKDNKGRDIFSNKGKYGPYIQVEKSYYKLMNLDPLTITQDEALQVIKDFEIYRANNPIDPNKPKVFKGKKKFKSFKKK